MRTEIHRERQRCERHTADAINACAQIQPHVGLAKTIDRLHRIADHKQSAAIIPLPAGGKPRQQLELRQRGILKLIHQQMAYAVVERQRQVSGRIILTQREQGGLRHRSEIGLAALAKNECEIGGGERQQGDQRFDDLPLRIAVGGRW